MDFLSVLVAAHRRVDDSSSSNTSAAGDAGGSNRSAPCERICASLNLYAELMTTRSGDGAGEHARLDR